MSSSSQHANTVRFVVGNTYKKVPLAEARLDRSGNYKKVHDWVLYVDVLADDDSDPDVLERVTFDLGSTFEPAEFTCSCPIPVTRPDGTAAWRFSTRQQSYGPVWCNIRLRGRGGSVMALPEIQVAFGQAAHQKLAIQTFRETRSLKPFRALKLPDNQQFGIELELSCVSNSAEQLADHLMSCSNSMPNVQVMIRNYAQGRAVSDDWKLVPDSSIMCNASSPDCNKFELVSPVLQGGPGLSQVATVLRGIGSVVGIQVNKSMGFHVHIDVSNLSLGQLIKVCQNFIKYEEVMDTFMPPSRRTNSPECQNYFASNQASVGAYGTTNRQRHDALAACENIESLVTRMNATGRYYKLNLQNLVTGRQPTIEFRQHSATVNYEKVGAWIRFCSAFVKQSARLAAPSPFAQDRSVDDKFEALFYYVIKDRALRDFYRQRREDLKSAVAEPCCAGCAQGGTCSVKRRAY